MENYLVKNKIGIKNLPNAIDWHFAGNWSHIFRHVSPYKKILEQNGINQEITWKEL